MSYSQNTMVACANCGRVIGKVATPYVWKDEPVCGNCYKELEKDAPKKMPSFAKFCMLVGLVAVLSGVGIAFWYGYIKDNPDMGGYGLFTSAGGITLFLLSAFLGVKSRRRIE